MTSELERKEIVKRLDHAINWFNEKWCHDKGGEKKTFTNDRILLELLQIKHGNDWDKGLRKLVT